MIQFFSALCGGGKRHLPCVFFKSSIFDLDTQIVGGLSGFFQTFSYFSGKLQENRIGFLSGGQVTGKGGGIADSFCLRRFTFESRVIHSIGVFPQHFPVTFQM